VALLSGAALWLSTRSAETCLSNNPNQEASPDDFVRGWEIADQAFHIWLNEFVIWEPGDFGGDTYTNVQNTICIVVDGTKMRVLPIAQITTILGRFDENRNLIGSHGGGMDASFNVTHLSGGRHTITVSLTTTQGRLLIKSWEFEYPEA
jgi:hypothetical protein